MDLNQKEIIISQGKKAIWQTIIAALLYTTSVFLFCYGCYKFYLIGLNETDTKIVKGNVSFFSLSIYAFLGAMHFSVVKTLFINTEMEKLKTQFSVGNIKVNHYSKIPELKYVSVFKNTSTEIIEVNLWYSNNKHFNVANYERIDDAMNFGMFFSNKLNLDLLDATERGNFKWIDKE